MSEKNKLEIKERCIVQFLANQPIPAICVGTHQDILDRIHYDLELILGIESDGHEKTTLILSVEPDYVFSLM